MNMNEYQKSARSTAIYPALGSNYIYPTLGLAGEAGEVSEKVKKLIRDKLGNITEEFQQDIKKELGDVLWYVANLASEIGLELDDIASTNIEKLQSRKDRGVLRGSGDDR